MTGSRKRRSAQRPEARRTSLQGPLQPGGGLADEVCRSRRPSRLDALEIAHAEALGTEKGDELEGPPWRAF